MTQTQRLTSELLARFICLTCKKANLRLREKDIRCESCGATYPAIREIYHFDAG